MLRTRLHLLYVAFTFEMEVKKAPQAQSKIQLKPLHHHQTTMLMEMSKNTGNWCWKTVAMSLFKSIDLCMCKYKSKENADLNSSIPPYHSLLRIINF